MLDEMEEVEEVEEVPERKNVEEVNEVEKVKKLENMEEVKEMQRRQDESQEDQDRQEVPQKSCWDRFKQMMVVITSFILVFIVDGSLYSNDIFEDSILEVSIILKYV